MKLKVLAFTSNRAEYDLMSPLYQLLNQDEDIDFKIIVSGAHLSHDYGFSYRQIQQDGLPVLIEIENLLNYDSKKSKLKSASIFLQNSIDIIASFSPDLLLAAGDREDMIPIGMISVFLNIPMIHFYGGDHEKAGHEDTLVRHATSKLATLHFVSCEEHARRLMSIGESQSRIFNVGSIALDRFTNETIIPRDEILTAFKLELTAVYALVIYHPSPDKKEKEIGGQVLESIIQALKAYQITVFISAPNTDEGNKQILQVAQKYAEDPGVVWFSNLDRRTFISLFKHSKLIIGNSSAGLLEAGSIPIAAINVGHRQSGRMCGDNVVFCGYQKQSIAQAIEKVLSDEFQANLTSIKNPYGDGQSSKKAYHLIKSLDLSSCLPKIEDPLYD